MADAAKIKIDLEGAVEAERQLNKLRESFKAFGSSVVGAVTGALTNLASLSTQLSTIDPSSAAQKFRDFRGAVTELGVASGRTVAELRASFSSLSRQTLLPDTQVAAFSKTLAKSTYDFRDSGKALTALRAEGVAAGRSLEEMAPIAETLHNTFGASFDAMPGMLDSIRAAAESLGTEGGPAALQDQIVALGGALSEVSIKGKGDAQELVAVLASFGKGLRPEQQKKVQQELLNTFVSGGEQLRRNLGVKSKDFYNDDGTIKFNAANVKRLRDFNLKQVGGNVEQAKARSALVHGRMYAEAMYGSNLDADIATAKAASSSDKGKKALGALLGTEHGVETGKALAGDQQTRDEVGSIANKAQQAMADALPEDPIVRAITLGFASVVASNLVGKGIESALKAGFAAMIPSAVSAAAVQTGAAGAGATIAGAGATAATLAARAIPIVALATVATLGSDNPNTEKNLAAMAATAANKKSIRYKHWYSGEQETEPVPGTGGGGSPSPKAQPMQVKVVVQNNTGMPLTVVNADKGNAGHQ